ncbi:MAG: hypothetical protein V4755_08935 [Curtobacterium sp.]
MTGTSAGGASGVGVHRAAAFVAAGQPREALAVLAAAGPAENETAAAHRVRALALLAIDEVDDALGAARQAVSLDPDDETGLWLTSTLLLRTGDQAGAVDAARRAVVVAPTSWRSHAGVAFAQFRDPARRVEALRASYDAVRLAPEEPDVHRRHGDLLLAAGRHRDAQAAYRRGLELAPGTTGTRHNLAVSRLRGGHEGESALAFSGILAVDPTDATARRNFMVAVVNPLARARGMLGFAAVMTGLMSLGVTGGTDTARLTTILLPVIGIVGAMVVVLRFAAETGRRTRSVTATARRAVPGWTALATVTLGALLVSVVSVFLPPAAALAAQAVVFVGVVIGSVQSRHIQVAFPRTRPAPTTEAAVPTDESSQWRNPA